MLNVEGTMAEKRDVYDKMLKLARKLSTEARQIDSDVNRQFRDHMFYRERYNKKQKSLFNVLTAYSIYNMEVSRIIFVSNVDQISYFHLIVFGFRWAIVRECLALLAFYSCTWMKSKHFGRLIHS